MKPHDANTKVSLIAGGIPHIFVTPEVKANIEAIIRNSNKSNEIGWIGTVTKLESGDYLIDDVFVPEQNVFPAHCDIEWAGLLKIEKEDPTINERLKFWGHLHPGNSTSPSADDDSQMEELAYNSYFIRGIFNRNGKSEMDIFDFEHGIKWKDVPWDVYYPLDLSGIDEYWANEINEKVTITRSSSIKVINSPCIGVSGEPDEVNFYEKYGRFLREDNRPQQNLNNSNEVD